MQCVGNGVVYVAGAVGALQVLRARARKQARADDRQDVNAPDGEPDYGIRGSSG